MLLSRQRFNLIFLAVFLTLLFAAFVYGIDLKTAESYFIVYEDHSVNDKIHPALRDLIEEDGYVEALVKLTSQVDTGIVARRALKNNVPRSRDEQVVVREAVVEKLRENAACSQKDIMRYLELEKSRGAVLEYSGYYVVNLIYVKSLPEVLEKVARRAEVEIILPNAVISGEQPGSLEMEEEAGLSTTVEWNIACINAPAAWEVGVDGTGVVIGIIDSGVYWEHEALKTRWRGYDVLAPGDPNPAYNWFDAVEGLYLPADSQWHGTHVAGTILGAGLEGNNLIGVAPGAQWIAARAFDSDDEAKAKWVLDAGQFMLAPTNTGGMDPRPELAPDIINNSWGGSEPGIEEWFRPMVQAWRDAQILPVFAAGNQKDGAGPASIVHPANYPESFAVGALNRYNNLAGFSRRGPGPYDNSIKPAISAPGVSIRSSTPDGYGLAQGTSMAAPHVSGTAALILSAEPGLSVEDLEQRIIDTAVPMTDSSYPDSPNYGFGYGLIDAFASLDIEPEPVYYLGHVTGAQTISAQDAQLVMSYIVGLVELVPAQQIAADVNGDGEIDVDDVILIMKYILGIIEDFPV